MRDLFLIMKLRLIILALLAATAWPENGNAQSFDANGLRGSGDISDDISSDDDDDLISSSPGTSTRTTSTNGTRPATTGSTSGAAATPRSRPDARAERARREESRRAERPVQPGQRQADGTIRTFQGSVQTAVTPDDNFNDDADLYEPLGLRLGKFTIRSSVEITGGVSDNVNRVRGGKSGSYYRISPDIRGESDWARHQLNFQLRGGYNGYLVDSMQDEPSLDASITGRIDIRDGTRIDLEATYQYEVEDPSSAEVLPGFSNDGVHTLRGSAGITQDVQNIELSATGSIQREEYSDPSTGRRRTPGSDDRDNTLPELTLQAGYKVSPRFKPFIRGSIFSRHFDQERDSSGIRRSSTGHAFAAGVESNFGPKLTGELALGWRREDLRDRRFDPLEGPTVDGSLVWSPSRLTTIKATLNTTFDTTTISTSSGSIEYAGLLTASRSLRRNLTLDAGVGLSKREYEGMPLEEWRRTATASLTWAFNRNVAAVLRYNYEDLDSSRSGSNYSANSVEFGVTLRH